MRVRCLSLSPDPVRVGDKLRFAFALHSTEKRAQTLLIDYAVHFVKSNGDARPKVFKLKKVELPPAGRMELSGRVAFTPMTTRRHHPGRHQIDVLVNGVAFRLATFDLEA